jgi:hypothetical protein
MVVVLHDASGVLVMFSRPAARVTGILPLALPGADRLTARRAAARRAIGVCPRQRGILRLL